MFLMGVKECCHPRCFVLSNFESRSGQPDHYTATIAAVERRTPCGGSVRGGRRVRVPAWRGMVAEEWQCGKSMESMHTVQNP